jgi:dipeptidyl aminopeptidase/acylaminoacyl peptidase
VHDRFAAVAAAVLVCAFTVSAPSAALAAAPSTEPAATAPQPLSAETMWQLQRVGDPRLSPDGRRAVVPVTRYDVKENKGYTDLYVIPTAGGPAERLTSDAAADNEPRWSPDGKWIAFVSKRGEDKQNQLYVIPTAGGEARRVTDWPTGVSAPEWFPDSKRLAFISRVWTDLKSKDDQGKRLKEREESKMTARVWEKAPVTHWDRFIDDREAHVFVTDLDGAEPFSPTLRAGQPLSVREPGPDSYAISPDGAELAFASNTDRTGTNANMDLYTTPIAGGPAKNLTAANPASDGSPSYSPDGRWLAFEQQRIRGFYADRARLMLVDRRTGATRSLTEDWDRAAGGLVWAPDSKGLYGSIDDSAARRVYWFGVDGGAPRPITKQNDFTSLQVAGKPATLVGLRQSFTEPPTLVRIDARTGAATQLSTFNDAALKNVSFGPVESVTYKGANDADIQMWVVKPPGFDPKKKYPLFLILHGGPHNGITDTWQWRWNAQIFAGWGYVAAWHNFHGSSGFGNAFADSINPNWMDLPYTDTIKAADWFRAQPWIDADRMVAGGGSYGGYLASVLLGREHPFRTLIAHAKVYNLYTHDGVSDFGAEKDRFQEFWENRAEFEKYSPHLYAGNFKTPTLVIHGQLDYRVPVSNGFELFNTLQKRGIPSKLVYYPDENHWILKPQNSLFWYSTVRDWVERYAKP